MWLDFPKKHWQVFKFIYENKLMLGYPDDTFKPWNYITERQVVAVAKRGNIRTNIDVNQYNDVPATMKWIQDYFLPGTVLSANLDDKATRFRFAVMLTRNGLVNHDDLPIPPATPLPKPTQDEIVASKIDKWLDETYVTWNGATRQPRIKGMGYLFVKMSRMHGVPLWLALGQCWRESQFFTTGLSIKYNCGWGIKDSKGKWGKVRSQVSGYTDYISLEESISAYFRLMGSDNAPYKKLIDAGKIREALDIYAPPFENDSNEHYNIVMKIKRMCEEKGIK